VTKNKNEIKRKKNSNDFEWLKKENDFRLVYKNGQSLVSQDKKLKAKYFFLDDEDNNKVKAGISVSSDKGNSVWRNRIKRILRESIKNEKETLLKIAKQKNSELLLIFSPDLINQNNFKQISFRDLSEATSSILNGLKESALLQRK